MQYLKDLLSLKYSDLIQLASVKFSFYICSTKSLKTRILFAIMETINTIIVPNIKINI